MADTSLGMVRTSAAGLSIGVTQNVSALLADMQNEQRKLNAELAEQRQNTTNAQAAAETEAGRQDGEASFAEGLGQAFTSGFSAASEAYGMKKGFDRMNSEYPVGHMGHGGPEALNAYERGSQPWKLLGQVLGGVGTGITKGVVSGEQTESGRQRGNATIASGAAQTLSAVGQGIDGVNGTLAKSQDNMLNAQNIMWRAEQQA